MCASEAATGALRTIKRYTKEEDDLIFETFWSSAQREETARRLNRPLRGITYRFYQLLRLRGMTPQEYLMQKDPETAAHLRVPRGRPRGTRRELKQESFVHKPVRMQSSDSDLLSELAKFPESVKRFEDRLSALEEEVAEIRKRNGINLRDLIAGLQAIDTESANRHELYNRISVLEEENDKLRSEVSEEKSNLIRERDELKKVYNDLEGVLHTFMNLSSVDKLRVLGDFSTQLVTTVDRFGNVVGMKTILK